VIFKDLCTKTLFLNERRNLLLCCLFSLLAFSDTWMIDANDSVTKITDNQQKAMKSVTNVFSYQIFHEPYSYFLLFLSSKPI
jgi:hypothetical protein